MAGMFDGMFDGLGTSIIGAGISALAGSADRKDKKEQLRQQLEIDRQNREDAKLEAQKDRDLRLLLAQMSGGGGSGRDIKAELAQALSESILKGGQMQQEGFKNLGDGVRQSLRGIRR